MASPIEDSIRDCLQWHKASSDCHNGPDRLYLGHKEHDQLLGAAQPFLGKIKPADIVNNENRRPEWNGMKVYRVDAQSFIGFGHDDPSPCG